MCSSDLGLLSAHEFRDQLHQRLRDLDVYRDEFDALWEHNMETVEYIRQTRRDFDFGEMFETRNLMLDAFDAESTSPQSVAEAVQANPQAGMEV